MKRAKSKSLHNNVAGRPLGNKSRCKSSPELGRSGGGHGRHHIKGILKFRSVDASLHSTYGEKSSSSSNTTTNTSNNSETKEGADADDDCDDILLADRRIQFKDIIVREYSRTVGDNPSCSSGPPVTISWDYDPETKILAIDEYEELRPPRRTHFEMVLPRDVRQRMLRKEWDVTQTQIAAAVRANIKAKNQRRSTVNNLGKATKMEEMMESAGRRVKRSLLFQKSVSKQVQDLEEQLAVVQCARAAEDMQEMMKDEVEAPEAEGSDVSSAGILSQEELSSEVGTKVKAGVVPAAGLGSPRGASIMIMEESSDEDIEDRSSEAAAVASSSPSPPRKDSPENPQEEQQKKQQGSPPSSSSGGGLVDRKPRGSSVATESSTAHDDEAVAEEDQQQQQQEAGKAAAELLEI